RGAGPEGPRRERSAAVGTGTPIRPQFSAADRGGGVVDGRAGSGAAVFAHAGDVAAAVRHRRRDRRRLLGPRRSPDGGVLHGARDRGAVYAISVVALVHGGGIWWSQHRIRFHYRPEVRWLRAIRRDSAAWKRNDR